MDIKELDFVDVITTCRLFLEDPDNKENAEAFQNIKQNMVIRPYLSLKQKEIILKKILIECNIEDPRSFMFATVCEVATIMDGLLAYTNIGMDIDNAWKTYEVCDTLAYCGILDYILDYCERDYKNLKSLIGQMYSWENVQHLFEMAEDISGENLEKLTGDFERFTSSENMEILSKLSDVLGYNDPIIKDVKDSMEEEAYKTIMKIDENQTE